MTAIVQIEIKCNGGVSSLHSNRNLLDHVGSGEWIPWHPDKPSTQLSHKFLHPFKFYSASSCPVACAPATPIYSAVLLILWDMFCTPFATEEGPFGAKTFAKWSSLPRVLRSRTIKYLFIDVVMNLYSFRLLIVTNYCHLYESFHALPPVWHTLCRILLCCRMPCVHFQFNHLWWMLQCHGMGCILSANYRSKSLHSLVSIYSQCLCDYVCSCCEQCWAVFPSFFPVHACHCSKSPT